MLKYLLRKTLKIQAGLEPLPHDTKDLGFSMTALFGLGYKPKHLKKILTLPFAAKLQRFNTCGWVGSTGSKEFDEEVELDEQVTVLFGKERGLVSGDGFSNLRSNEIVLKKDGCAEKGFIKKECKNWAEYSDAKLLTKEIRENAKTHRSKSFSAIHYTSQILKAIDDGRPVKIGINWRTAMNASRGFSFPFILDFIKGWLVGGHAMYVFGYDSKYTSETVFKIRNSFGPAYGAQGDCYIKESDLQKEIKRYGAYVNYDIDRDILKWLSLHQGAVVKTDGDKNVYLIQGDKKRKYNDLATLYAHGKHDQNIINVPEEYLNEVVRGKDILFWDGGNVKAIKAIIQQKDKLKPIFDEYFTELFN